MPLMRQLVEAMKVVAAGGSFPEDKPIVFHKVEGAPTLAGYQPDEGDEESWAAYHATHPERKGKVPKQGTPYLHYVGPIHLQYKK